jgi:hypothetical protein
MAKEFFFHTCFKLHLYILTSLHKLNDGHLGVVTLTGNSSQDTGVSSLAVSITIWSGFEERVDELLVVDPGKGLTTSVQISSLSELNHVVDMFSHRSCTNQSGLDASVPDNFGGKSTKQSLSLISGLSQLVESMAVRNHIKG